MDRLRGTGEPKLTIGVIHREHLALVGRCIGGRRPYLIKDLQVLPRIHRHVRRHVGNELYVTEIERQESRFPRWNAFRGYEWDHFRNLKTRLWGLGNRYVLLCLEGRLLEDIGQKKLELVFARCQRQPAFISEWFGLHAGDLRLGEVLARFLKLRIDLLS